MTLASDYVRFGWQYRSDYERQVKNNDDVEVRFSLEYLPNAVSWTCLAIMSGIIGGASWDAVKAIIGRIRNQTNDLTVASIADDEKTLIQFREYMLSYHQSFTDVPLKVRDALIEEMMAHVSETTLELSDLHDGNIPKQKWIAIAKKTRKRMRGKISNMMARQLWQALK